MDECTERVTSDNKMMIPVGRYTMVQLPHRCFFSSEIDCGYYKYNMLETD